MKSITQGPWKWSHHTNTLSEANEAVLMASPNGDSAAVVIALGPDWQEPLRCDIEHAKAMLLIEAVPEMRDALLDLVGALAKHHPGGVLPEVASALKSAQALVERIAPVRLPGAWEKIEGQENLYVKTYASPGVWIEAHIAGSRISLRAKREFLLRGVMKAAIEVGRANVHACDQLEIDAAIRELEQRLDEALCSAKENDHA
ncbi:hypothetical protein [Thauera sp. WH-1]|uniref:hypothetical protein n=1 Tax=Thauera sp. WH-1 TaxID=3398230 RepID=UPI0039FBAF20